MSLKIQNSSVELSQIVQIGEQLSELSQKTGIEYLRLNRGINSVVNINLTEVIKLIDFNSPKIQTYPLGRGFHELREAINQEYFAGKSSPDNILIVPGAMNGLDIIAQSLDIDKLILPTYYWGCYYKQLHIRGVKHGSYDSLDSIMQKIRTLKDSAVLICDPGNPIGQKYDDTKLLSLIQKLNEKEIIVIFDSPYRRVFCDKSDTMHQELAKLENVIIVESFSKSLGISGQRIGFIHTASNQLYDDLERRTMYANNGVNTFAQILTHKLLTTTEGVKAVSDFKKNTTKDIKLNIDYLNERGFLATEFYEESVPRGIFVVVNRTQSDLLKHNIGSVSLDFFTKDRTLKKYASEYSRICVSVPHLKLKAFFDQIK